MTTALVPTAVYLFIKGLNITDEEKRIVSGYASTEKLDDTGEIVDLDGLREAIPEFMEWANLREMHDKKAVGKIINCTVDDKGLYVTAHVVDDTAWAKCKAGVLQGFSIGGAGEKDGNRIKNIRLHEISLVDRPANPECKFDVVKRLDVPALVAQLQVSTLCLTQPTKTGTDASTMTTIAAATEGVQKALGLMNSLFEKATQAIRGDSRFSSNAYLADIDFTNPEHLVAIVRFYPTDKSECKMVKLGFSVDGAGAVKLDAGDPTPTEMIVTYKMAQAVHLQIASPPNNKEKPMKTTVDENVQKLLGDLAALKKTDGFKPEDIVLVEEGEKILKALIGETDRSTLNKALGGKSSADQGLSGEELEWHAPVKVNTGDAHEGLKGVGKGASTQDDGDDDDTTKAAGAAEESDNEDDAGKKSASCKKAFDHASKAFGKLRDTMKGAASDNPGHEHGMKASAALKKAHKAIQDGQPDKASAHIQHALRHIGNAKKAMKVNKDITGAEEQQRQDDPSKTGGPTQVELEKAASVANSLQGDVQRLVGEVTLLWKYIGAMPAKPRRETILDLIDKEQDSNNRTILKALAGVQ